MNFALKTRKTFIKNEELCIKNEELCIKTDEFCRPPPPPGAAIFQKFNMEGSSKLMEHKIKSQIAFFYSERRCCKLQYTCHFPPELSIENAEMM